MGLGWSTSRDIFIHQWTNPRVEPIKKTITMRMIPSGLGEDRFSGNICFIPADPNDRKKGGPFAKMLGNIRDDERAVLLGIYWLTMHDECDVPIKIEIKDLFKPCPSNNDEEERKHPDLTGSVFLPCNGKISTVVAGNDRILYRPQKLNEATITKYAGLENAILESRTIYLPKHDKNNEKEKEEKEEEEEEEPLEVFPEDSPLVEYIIRTSNALHPQKGDIEKMEAEGKTFYHIKPDFLAHVRQFFKDTVGDYILYTRFEDTHLNVELESDVQEKLWNKYHSKAKHPRTALELPNIVFTLEFSYLLISPGEPSMQHKKIALK
jgi:hypothetical protein